jgi:glycosyltransferase involved in cell wall biosynthesis
VRKSQRITISVISDLVTDQRVHKVATTLHNNGYNVNVIGAKRKHSKSLQQQIYTTSRINLFFQKGFLQYAEWNVRLFFLLFFQKVDILVANDLDTLLPNFLQSKLRNKKLVYDSHEFFTEQEELIHRKNVRRLWLKLEQFILPKLKNVYTVNESIAAIYTSTYLINVGVIKNLPLHNNNIPEKPDVKIVKLFEQHKNKKILLTQGTGFNTNRGIEELIEAVYLLNSSDYVLFIIGTGLVINDLKQKVELLSIQNKVVFIPAVVPAQLKWITQQAYVGFTLDKATCLNYEYSLPNKLFDFIHASIPIIASNRVEVAHIINTEKIGIVINNVTPIAIKEAIEKLNVEEYIFYKQNTKKAALNYTWQAQEPKLLELYKSIT